MCELSERFKRETKGINKTYELSLRLSNVSPNQVKALNKLLDVIELEGVSVDDFNIQND